MLGMGDFWVGLVYLLCIASAVLCVVYGAICWNKGQEIPEPEAEREDRQWIEEERKVDEEL